MLKRLLTVAMAMAFALAPTGSQAIGDGTGFKTGRCDLATLGVAPGSSGDTLQVGAGKQFTTIQAAVNAAGEGDHIIVFPGEYNEEVFVTNKDGLRITGTDRDTVVINGGNTRAHGIFVRSSDRVLIENMTGRNHTKTSFFWLSSTGYWARYLTTYNQGDYGVYAYDSRCGQIDHSYASAGADSGFYIGECYPCDAVITDVEAEENGLGYSGTNAGGNLTIRDSWWHGNALGIVPNSLDSEAGPPQRGITIENNLVENNNGKNVPGVGAASLFYGVGIGLAGGQGNHVIGNTVRDHTFGGIIVSLITFPPNTLLYLPSGNTIWGNTVLGSGLADIAQGATSGPGNCYQNNTYGTTAPVALELIWSCTNFDDNGEPKLPYYPTASPPGGDPRVEQGFAEAASAEVTRPVLGMNGPNGRNPGDWKTWPAPTCANSPSSCVNLPDENGDSSYVNDGAPDLWLPALL